MRNQQEYTLRHNTAYYNFNLLKELDYVIEGDGRANHEFIFNFNNFVESFVLNEHFLLSSQELKHHFLTAKATSKEGGRPITHLVLKNPNGFQIMGFPFYMKMGTVLYAEDVPKTIDRKGESILYMDFQEKNADYLNRKFSKPYEINDFEYKYPLLIPHYETSQNPENKRFIIFETTNTPKNLITSLNSTLPDSNFQTTFSLGAIKDQIETNQNLGITKPTLKILKSLHDNQIDEIVKYSGYKKIPIPPLVPILLSQCKSIDDIPEKISQLRDDFQDLRKSFYNFEKRISNSKNLKEQFEIIEEYNKFWEVFDRKNKIKTNRLMFHFWDFSKESKVQESFENVIDTGNQDEFLKDLDLTKIGAKSVLKVLEYFRDQKALNRFKGITDLWDLFQNSPTLKNQARDLERIFGIKVDLDELNRIAKSVAKKPLF